MEEAFFKPRSVAVVAFGRSQLNASFAALMPPQREHRFSFPVVLTSIVDWAVEEGIGFSKLVSLGNRADVTEPFYGLLGGLRYSCA